MSEVRNLLVFMVENNNDTYEVRLFKNATDVVSAILTNEINVFQFLGHFIYVRTNNQCTSQKFSAN